MRNGKDLTWAPHRTISIVLIAVLLAGAGKLMATHAIPHRGAAPSSQAPCPTQADCDKLKQIADAAAAAAAAAQAVADQAQADLEKDLKTASQMEREGEFPTSPLAKDMRPSDRVALGQAKRAQAKALRDKLPNAKANAKAAADAAAAALKAYNDCVQKVKDCPPPSNPTGTTATQGSPQLGPWIMIFPGLPLWNLDERRWYGYNADYSPRAGELPGDELRGTSTASPVSGTPGAPGFQCKVKTPIFILPPAINVPPKVSQEFDCTGNGQPSFKPSIYLRVSEPLKLGELRYDLHNGSNPYVIPGTLLNNGRTLRFDLPVNKTNAGTGIPNNFTVNYAFMDALPLKRPLWEHLRTTPGIGFDSQSWNAPVLDGGQYGPFINSVIPDGNGRINSTPYLCLDGTTSSTVLPYTPDFSIGTWQKYGGPKFNYAYDFPKDVYVPGSCTLNGTNGSVRLRPTEWFNDDVNSYSQKLIQTWMYTPETAPTPSSTTGDLYDPQLIRRLARQVVRLPRYNYVRPLVYEDYDSQLMEYFRWLLFGSHCENDFPYELQKQLGIVTACRPTKSPRVIAARSLPVTERPRLQTVSLRTGTADTGGQGRVPKGAATDGFTYAIVSNGKSTGEAFQLQMLDPTGKVKSVEMEDGTVLEAIRPGVTQPLTARGGGNLVTQPLNGFCLEFKKHPPAEGTMYRIASAETQQKYRSLRFLSGAGAQMKDKNMFHPDSNPAAYMDAIMQYSVWIKLNGWTFEQFVENFVERTKENAAALKVKWTPEMETTLRNAAPGRWRDTSEMLQEAQDLEKASGGRRGGRGGRGARGGRGGTQQDQ
jgi:hypothetical protein